MSASADLDHTAMPDVFHVRTTFEGRVLFNRCARCHGRIWRTAERFMWQHSIPSRKARLENH